MKPFLTEFFFSKLNHSHCIGNQKQATFLETKNYTLNLILKITLNSKMTKKPKSFLLLKKKKGYTKKSWTKKLKN